MPSVEAPLRTTDYVQMPWAWTVAIVACCLAGGAVGAAVHPAVWLVTGFAAPLSASVVVWLLRRKGRLTWPLLAPRRRPWALSLLVTIPGFLVALWFVGGGSFAGRLVITAFICWGYIVAPQLFGRRSA